MEGDENVERIHDVPRAKEVIIELPDTGVDKTELESVALRLKKYLCLHDETLVKSGYRSSVPLTVIVGVHDPYLTGFAAILVKSTKPDGEVQITGRTRVVVESTFMKKT